MGQTTIPFGDPKAQMKWSGRLLVETLAKSYWERFISTSENAVIQRKTELESDAGDRISFDLSVQLRGGPTSGDNRLKGTEEQLKFFTDEVIIDQLRKSVSAGGKMTRKRTAHDLRRVAKDRLIMGDPEECLTEFQRWSEGTGAESCLLRLRHAHSGGPSHAQIMKTIDLIGDRIIPYMD